MLPYLSISYRFLSVKYAWEWAIRERKSFTLSLLNGRSGPRCMPSRIQEGIKLFPSIGIFQFIIRMFNICILLYHSFYIHLFLTSQEPYGGLISQKQQLSLSCPFCGMLTLLNFELHKRHLHFFYIVLCGPLCLCGLVQRT